MQHQNHDKPTLYESNYPPPAWTKNIYFKNVTLINDPCEQEKMIVSRSAMF